MPILSLENISYSYHTLQGETNALRNISFQVEKGDFIAIVGPSGCGKSTLLSIIAGLLKPDKGEIYFKDINQNNTQIGYMLQKDYLLPWRTIIKNITLPLEINKNKSVENMYLAEKLLKDYELYEFKDKYPQELSGGMRQRVALIRTLIQNPSLILLDEPFSALDYQTRLNVSNDISNLLKKAGKTAILITHDLSEAISLANKIIVLSKRPAYVKNIIEVNLTINNNSPLAALNAPEYKHYFNLLWEELYNE